MIHAQTPESHFTKGHQQIIEILCRDISFGTVVIISIKYRKWYCSFPIMDRFFLMSYFGCFAWWATRAHGQFCPGINSSIPGQNGRLFADDIFRCISANEKFCILIKISLRFVPWGPIDNNPVLIQIMTWRRIGDKPLSEPMLTRITDGYIRH